MMIINYHFQPTKLHSISYTDIYLHTYVYMYTYLNTHTLNHRRDGGWPNIYQNVTRSYLWMVCVLYFTQACITIFIYWLVGYKRKMAYFRYLVCIIPCMCMHVRVLYTHIYTHAYITHTYTHTIKKAPVLIFIRNFS